VRRSILRCSHAPSRLAAYADRRYGGCSATDSGFLKPTTVAKFFAGRMHYAWIVLVVMFFAMLAGVGVRAAPAS
jgi:hypothetical protein